MRSDRLVASLFVALALVQLVPIWSVHYLPTTDGPEHLYNSWVLHGLVTRTAPPAITSYFAVDWRPNPNWIGHAAMAVLIAVVPPLVAEKLLFSAIVLTFLFGAWMFAGADDERCRVYALLAFPFVCHQMLQYGFYNFAFSFALWLIVVGYWWKRRDRPSARTLASTAALLILCYFSHPMSTALAIGSIGLLWLATLRRHPFREHVRHLVPLIPATTLLLWFAALHADGVLSDRKSLGSLLSFLAQTEVLFTFDRWQLVAGWIVAGILVTLTIATLVREKIARRDADAFLLLFASFLGLYLWSPSAFAGGTLLTERMALFVELALLPWFSPRLDNRIRYGVLVVMSLFAIVNAGYLTAHFRKADRHIAELVRAIAPVAPDSTLLPLMFNRGVPGSHTDYMSHVPAYAAIEKRFVDLDNYEPGTGYFPLAYAKGVDVPPIDEIEAKPDQIDPAAYAGRARFILTRKLPDPSDLAVRLSRHYRLVSRSGDTRIYESRIALSKLKNPEVILLPLAGTTGEVGSTVRWRVDQEIRNGGTKPIRVLLNTCATTPCDFEIAPGKSAALTSDDQPYVIIRTEHDTAAQLLATTMLRRTDPAGGGFSIAIDAVRENEFRPSEIVFHDVALTSAQRLNLRMWVIHHADRAAYSVTILRKSGEHLAQRMFATSPTGYVTDTNVGGQFPQLVDRGLRADVVVRVEKAALTARLWGFITATDSKTGLPRLMFPER